MRHSIWYRRERHIQGWEVRSAAIPYGFHSSEDFFEYFRTFELTTPWLNCFADYLERESNSRRIIQDNLSKWFQFRFSESVLNDKSHTTFKDEVYNNRCRLIPCTSTVRVIQHEHFQDVSVVTIDFDRRLLVPQLAGFQSIADIEFDLLSRNINPPQHFVSDIITERITIVHRFNTEGDKVVEWNWNYEDNDISSITIPDNGFFHLENAYKRINEYIMSKINRLNEQRIKDYTIALSESYADPILLNLIAIDPESRQQFESRNNVTKTEAFALGQTITSLEDKLCQVTSSDK